MNLAHKKQSGLQRKAVGGGSQSVAQLSSAKQIVPDVIELLREQNEKKQESLEKARRVIEELGKDLSAATKQLIEQEEKNSELKAELQRLRSGTTRQGEDFESLSPIPQRQQVENKSQEQADASGVLELEIGTLRQRLQDADEYINELQVQLHEASVNNSSVAGPSTQKSVQSLLKRLSAASRSASPRVYRTHGLRLPRRSLITQNTFFAAEPLEQRLQPLSRVRNAIKLGHVVLNGSTNNLSQTQKKGRSKKQQSEENEDYVEEDKRNGSRQKSLEAKLTEKKNQNHEAIIEELEHRCETMQSGYEEHVAAMRRQLDLLGEQVRLRDVQLRDLQSRPLEGGMQGGNQMLAKENITLKEDNLGLRNEIVRLKTENENLKIDLEQVRTLTEVQAVRLQQVELPWRLQESHYIAFVQRLAALLTEEGLKPLSHSDLQWWQDNSYEIEKVRLIDSNVSEQFKIDILGGIERYVSKLLEHIRTKSLTAQAALLKAIDKNQQRLQDQNSQNIVRREMRLTEHISICTNGFIAALESILDLLNSGDSSHLEQIDFTKIAAFTYCKNDQVQLDTEQAQKLTEMQLQQAVIQCLGCDDEYWRLPLGMHNEQEVSFDSATVLEILDEQLKQGDTVLIEKLRSLKNDPKQDISFKHYLQLHTREEINYLSQALQNTRDATLLEAVSERARQCLCKKREMIQFFLAQGNNVSPKISKPKQELLFDSQDLLYELVQQNIWHKIKQVDVQQRLDGLKMSFAADLD